MTFLALLPVGLSILVLAAHFFRAGQFVPCALTLALLALTAVRRPWAARTLQAVLVLASAEWIRSAFRFVGIRQRLGLPSTRLALILGAVALFTALSALVFETRRMRTRYGLERQPETPS